MTTADPTAADAELRRTAGAAVHAMLEALDPAACVAAALHATPAAAVPARVHLLAIGKAADRMAAGAAAALGSRIVSGLIVAPEDGRTAGSPPDGVERRTGSHPYPDESSADAAHAVLAMLRRIPNRDALIVLLSGGASSLVALAAPGITLDELAATHRVLLAAPLPIEQVNAVRKHIDHSKGGRLTEATAAGTIRVLAISDVVGDRVDVIGSGPFHPNTATFADATAALRTADAWDRVPPAVRRVLESGAAGEARLPPASSRMRGGFGRVRHEVIARNATGRAALARALADGGSALRVAIQDEALVGDAEAAGVALARRARALPAGEALVTGGETVVTVIGDGRGGRNQQLALAAALALDGAAGIVLASIATDGIDGPTDAAGAIVDGSTAARIRAAGIDPADALRRNDAYTALDAADSLLRTGPTGTNVADVQLVLTAPAAPGA